MTLFRLAFKNLWIRSTRTMLTLLGISVVVAIFFSLFSFGKGYEKALEGEFSSFGIHILAVPKGCPYEATSLLMHGGNIEGSLSMKQLEEIRQHPQVKIASPLYNRHTKINPDLNPGNFETALYAIETDLFDLKPFWEFKEGRPFESNDAKEVILGHQAAQAVQAKIGDELAFIVHKGEDKLTIKGTLVGILNITGTSDDNFIFIPFAWIQELVEDRDIIKAVAVQTMQGSTIADVSMDLSLLRDVQTVTFRQAQYTLQQLLDTTRQLLQIALVFTLLLGLIGLINTMFMSVEERKKEIGMLKALGAQNRQLVQLIITETVFLVFMGSILGILWSVGLSNSIEAGIRALIESAPPGKLSYFSWPIAFLTVGGAVIAGGLSALFPTGILLNISPLEVIRNE